MLKSGLITPYRNVRYHLKEYSGNPPRNARKLFNHRHSSLHNAIERAFGVLKKRFPIIASGTEPNYRMKIQNLIILSCFILYNYLIKKDPDHVTSLRLIEKLKMMVGMNNCNIEMNTKILKDERI